MNRNKVLAIIIFGIVSTVAGAILAHPSKPLYSLKIETAKSTFALGEPILLDITYLNLSKNTLPWISYGNAEIGDEIIVTEEDGAFVQKTRYGKCSNRDTTQTACPDFSAGSSGGGISSFSPGGEAHDSTILSNLYEFNHAGKYRVMVKSRVPPQIGSGVAKSNILVITLTN